jgi:hypothetical protein
MSVATISFFSFLTGIGSCAAFQGALKTGMQYHGEVSSGADADSYLKLANTPRDGNGLSTLRLWIECFLLHRTGRRCISREYLGIPSLTFVGYFASCLDIHTLSSCG